MPIISANTQSRKEGYFRREWNLAVARTLDMAEGIAFMLPIVIDGTPDSQALVPEKFREVHWTQLRAGEPTQEFVARVAQLNAASEAQTEPLATVGQGRPGTVPATPHRSDARGGGRGAG